MNATLPNLARYTALTHRIMRRAPEVLRQHRLAPLFKHWLLTDDGGLVVLFGVLNDDAIVRQTQRPLRAYLSDDVLHDISTILDGLPVVPSNTSGLRYAFVLDTGNVAQLPQSVAFPGLERGQLLLGVTHGGKRVAVPWGRVGHTLLAGMTRSGKSTLLRSLVYQALADSFQLGLVDVSSRTFDMLADHPALVAPLAKDLDRASDVIEAALAEMARRDRLFRAAPDFPDNVDEYNRGVAQHGGERLARLLLVLDEYNALLLALGGPKGAFSKAVTTLALEGLKWGIHLVIAGHEFQREATGLVRGQCDTRVCFRVEDHTTSSIILSNTAATRLTVPGRAIVRGVGQVQTYLLDKQALIRTQRVYPAAPTLTQAERGLALQLLQQHDGALNESSLARLGLGQRPARRLMAEWKERGWAAHDRTRANACTLQPALVQLLETESL